MSKTAANVHGCKGVYCGGDWIDIEDCEKWLQGGCNGNSERSKAYAKYRQNEKKPKDGVYDVVIIGAGCIGSSIARELSKYNCSVLLLERDDDVTQGATKGNSGLVHAGYDDKPGTNRAKFCWPGNQMFAKLDQELKFGFCRNGSLVCARGPKEEKHLEELLERGRKNGVQNLRIVDKSELQDMEPHLSEDVTAALHSPDAGIVIPYEFAIALAENAAENGVEVKIRQQVVDIDFNDGVFRIHCHNWDPAIQICGRPSSIVFLGLGVVISIGASMYWPRGLETPRGMLGLYIFLAGVGLTLWFAFFRSFRGQSGAQVNPDAKHATLAFKAPEQGRTDTFKAKRVINCAGLFADKIARMVNDSSFTIKPRVGDYLLLNKSQGHLAKHILFPCPDPVLGKGVLVQATLWGNLILGPTARDVNNPEKLRMTNDEIIDYIIQKCRLLIPSFDASEVIHSFSGSRAKSDRGDWIIENSKVAPGFIHAAGIDSPGLAGSPAVAIEVVKLLEKSGLKFEKDPHFDPIRRPLIVPKNNWKSINGERLKVYKAGANVPPDQKILCKCEKVTEAEIIRSLHTSLPVDNTQAVRRRTRAGMGHCQAGEFPHCEERVKEVIQRELEIPFMQVGTRPWPATSFLPERWLSEKEKQKLGSI
uniref:FAD dependent oxidoreductase domain-containing protein n=1 Tax=Mucochytrium quahogii TaxID=96639 RepID=A0A7S2S8Y7_9STRA|mmetsp:Transcript_25711/g.55806  ORF Transcript_25711/g.55806 Transcript_25711/m.55806 type:complete len:647 (+) Transcript_25711:51-1991(+)